MRVVGVGVKGGAGADDGRERERGRRVSLKYFSFAQRIYSASSVDNLSRRVWEVFLQHSFKTTLENDWTGYRGRYGAPRSRRLVSFSAPGTTAARCTSGPGGRPWACNRTRPCRSCCRRWTCAACWGLASTSRDSAASPCYLQIRHILHCDLSARGLIAIRRLRFFWGKKYFQKQFKFCSIKRALIVLNKLPN